MHIKNFMPALALLASLSIGVSDLPAEDMLLDEHQVKAAFLYNFAKFIEWPEAPPPRGDKSFKICVFDGNHHIVIETLLRGKQIEDLAVAISSLQAGQGVRGCRIVFVGESHDNELGRIAAAAKGNGVLVVAESEGAAKKGAMINFFLEDNRVRFEINIDEARREGLRISSKLLRLGRIVSGSDSTEKKR